MLRGRWSEVGIQWSILSKCSERGGGGQTNPLLKMKIENTIKLFARISQFQGCKKLLLNLGEGVGEIGTFGTPPPLPLHG